MKILGKLFGGEEKARIIRLFLFNPETSYTVAEISKRTAVKGAQAQSILATLLNLGLIGKKGMAKKRAYFLDHRFPYIAPLSELLALASVKADNRLIAKLMPAGKIKLIIAGGVFTRQDAARLDLLIVGDDINEGRLARIVESIEADIGRDLSYSNLSTSDFNYRLGLHDRLIRDVVDFSHIVLLDKIGFRAGNVKNKA